MEVWVSAAVEGSACDWCLLIYDQMLARKSKKVAAAASEDPGAPHMPTPLREAIQKRRTATPTQEVAIVTVVDWHLQANLYIFG